MIHCYKGEVKLRIFPNASIQIQEEILLAQAEAAINRQTLSCGDQEFALSDIADLAMHGQRALVFTADKQYYELLPAKGSNSFKFFLYYDQVKNKKKLRETVR